MELEIHTETGSVLKPVFNAAQCTLSEGRVDVSGDGLRIWGNDLANVAGIDIMVSPETFDVYDFQEGAFETDFNKLWDALREGKKGDSYTLHLETPEYDAFEDMFSVGMGERHVLHSLGYTSPTLGYTSPTLGYTSPTLGYTSPKDIEGASVEDPVGEATYTVEVLDDENHRWF